MILYLVCCLNRFTFVSLCSVKDLAHLTILVLLVDLNYSSRSLNKGLLQECAKYKIVGGTNGSC